MTKPTPAVPGGNVAALIFELPEHEEALIQAVQGMKWQQLVVDVINILTHLRDTAPPEHREAYRQAVLFIRDEMQDAGLTTTPAEALKRQRKERQKRYAKELEKTLKEEAEL